MSSEGVNPYELLGLSIESTEQEIKTAYRQKCLKAHPDRNRGNPDAARKFHELQQAQERLLDPVQRKQLDTELRSKEASKARYEKYDAKRKGLVEELERRERGLKKARVDHEAEKERQRENERIMAEGRQLREQRERELQKRGQKREVLLGKTQRGADARTEPPSTGPLDTTVRVRYTLSSRPDLVDATSIATILSPFGAVDESSTVLSLKLSASKKAKYVTSLVPFADIGGAFAAVCASERAEYGLQHIEVTWAGGGEPELIGWLKKTGQLGETTNTKPLPSTDVKSSMRTLGLAIPAWDAFSSFPDLDAQAAPPRPNTPMVVPGLDYESLTLMRMRKEERERLAREIREQEAAESDQ